MRLSASKRFIVVATVLTVSAVVAVASDVTDKIRAGYEALSPALLRGDYETVADATYPKVIEMMGGKENAVAAMRGAMDQMRADGFDLLGSEVLRVSEPVQAGEEQHAVVETRVLIKTPEGKFHQDSYAVAVSSDGGVSWTFVDAGNAPPEMREMMFPEWNPDLKVPEPKDPVPVDAGE